MIFKYFHLGLRQVVMALMNWAIDVPQKLLQSDAKTGSLILFVACYKFKRLIILVLVVGMLNLLGACTKLIFFFNIKRS